MRLLIATALLCVSALPAFAEEVAPTGALREKWQAMTPAQKANWKKDHPESAKRQQENKAKIQAAREKWKNASPKERAGMKEKFRNEHPNAAARVKANAAGAK